MQQSYILSNKENEYTPEKSPLRLRINYQLRQKYHERSSKSPLNQQSFNRRTNFRPLKDNITPLLSTRKTDYNQMYIQQSDVQTYIRPINQNAPTLNNQRQSIAELSIVKPISLENRKLEQRSLLLNKEVQSVSNKNIVNQNDNSYSKSKHRQNAKHMGFIAKVGNLEKVNNQISSLLQYVYQNKTAPKNDKKDQQNSSYKPRYGLISENTKSYQRRITVLQKPKQAQPLISTFDVSQNSGKDYSQKKETKSLFKYEYSTFDQINKSPYRLLQQKNQNQIERQAPESLNKDLSPKHQEKSTKKLFQDNSIHLNTQKNQQITSALAPSQSQQKLSKLTNNNSDLQFYYESLKKRDGQIENFKKRILGPEVNSKEVNTFNGGNKYSNSKKYLNIEQESLSDKYKPPFKRRSQVKNYERQVKYGNQDRIMFQKNQNCKDQSRTFKKNIFLTEQEVEIYKDINKLNHGINKEKTSSMSRLERISQKRANLETQIQQEMNYAKRNMQFSIQNLNKNQPLQKHDDSFSANSYQISRFEERKTAQNIDSVVTSKIDEQIQKIKNQLKDCKKQKSYLRQKYGSILSKQISEPSSKIENSGQAQQKHTQEQASRFQTYQCHFDRDNERIYDSPYDLQRNRPNYTAQTVQNYHKELRNTIVSQNKTTFKDQKQQPKNCRLNSEFTDCQQNQERQTEPDQKIWTDQALNIPISNHVNEHSNQNANQQSFGQHHSQNYKKYNISTPRKAPKNFQILLHKVQITKPQTTKLGSLLAQKIQIDLKLRDQRQKFMKNTNPNKWNDLKSYLQSHYRIFKSMNQLEKLLTITPEQFNPFSPTSISSNRSQNKFSNQGKTPVEQTSNQQIHLLCSLLSQSLEFLQSRLLHKLSQKQLQKEHFQFRELDLNSKGYLSLQDLICFVNLHSGKFYRNRDIIFFVKGMILLQNGFESSVNTGFDQYNSAKGVNEYRLSYEFMWNALTYKQ